jgi:hypothetical protein
MQCSPNAPEHGGVWLMMLPQQWGALSQAGGFVSGSVSTRATAEAAAEQWREARGAQASAANVEDHV